MKTAKIDRSAANNQLTEADKNVAYGVAAIFKIGRDMVWLSEGMNGPADSPVSKLLEELKSKMEKNGNAVKGHLPQINKSISELINMSENIFGGDFTNYKPCDYGNCVPCSESFSFASSGGTVTLDENKVESALHSMRNNVNEIRDGFENAIQNYKNLYNLASEYEEVREAAHIGAANLRIYSGKIDEDLNKFTDDFNSLLDAQLQVNSTRSSDAQAKIESAKNFMNEYTQTLSNLSAG